MARIKRQKKLLWGAIIHAILLWGSLAIGYNSYKEVTPLPRVALDSIKATFPWSIIIFVMLYVFFGLGRDKKGYHLSVKQYSVTIFLYVAIISILYHSTEDYILIVQSLTMLSLIVVLLAWGGGRKFVDLYSESWLRELVSPVFLKALQKYVPMVKGYVVAYYRQDNASFFIVIFMVFIMICSFLLIFNEEKIAEHMASIAYFSLVVGVGIEVYRMVKYCGKDKEE